MSDLPAESRSRSARTLKRVLSWSKFLAWLSLTVAGKIFTALFFLVIGGVVALLLIGITALNRRDALSKWHTEVLQEEFTEDCGDTTFAEYLAREERLFQELEERIYTDPATDADSGLDEITVFRRFRRGSPSDPTSHTPHWNRTFEWPPTAGSPTCGVLLLHGMSDSPYSLRALGESLHKEGAHVIGLRLPGHGTAPSGLLEFTHKDMEAAVALAMKHLRDTVGTAPLYLIGYSNGGALAVHYSLEALEDETLPAASGIVLISPAIGVTGMAAFAVWQGRVGHWLGLEKLAWNSISAEYDPYKYNSFSVNAGDQVYRLTLEIRRHLDRHSEAETLSDFPPILAFQSAVDSTVSTPALIEGLFAKLPGDRHELVLFDLNRVGQIENFLRSDPKEPLTRLIRSANKPFALTVLTNRGSENLALEVRQYARRDDTPILSDPGLTWPDGLYSLSHVALPFSPEDPIYGAGLGLDQQKTGFRIGNLALRGEKGVLQISPVDQLRLRWNPFYSYLEGRVADFTVRRQRP